MVNTGIQVLQKTLKQNSKVIGTMSCEGDPEEPEARKKSIEGRRKFWEACGFTIIETNDKANPMEKAMRKSVPHSLSC